MYTRELRGRVLLEEKHRGESLVNFLGNERVSEGLVDGQTLGRIKNQTLFEEIFELVNFTHVSVVQ